MRDTDEFLADSGEPIRERGISRGTALKVGGLGLAGAFAAFLPGRAGAMVKKQASNASCQGTGFLCYGSNQPKTCGYDTGPTASASAASSTTGRSGQAVRRSERVSRTSRATNSRSATRATGRGIARPGRSALPEPAARLGSRA